MMGVVNRDRSYTQALYGSKSGTKTSHTLLVIDDESYRSHLLWFHLGQTLLHDYSFISIFRVKVRLFHIVMEFYGSAEEVPPLAEWPQIR